MRALHRAAMATIFIALMALFIPSIVSLAQDKPPESLGPSTAPARDPTVMVRENHEVQGILGKEVRSAADASMDRIIDLLVDTSEQARTAIIDFGGFLGVGSRKIAVARNAGRFPSAANTSSHMTLELMRDQVRAAPEYKEGKPVVVLGASGSLESLPFP